MALTLTSRRTKRLLLFISKPLLAAIFVTILLRLLFFPSKSNHKKNTTANKKIPKAVIIASTTSSNLTWLTQTPSPLSVQNWKPYIYVTDEKNAEFTVPVNKGNEAMVYLTWIIDHYHEVEQGKWEVMFFHHDHERAWHQMFSSEYELGHLNVESVRRQGYLSPRCLPGCENVITLSGDVVALEDLKGMSRDVMISSVLHEFWRDERGERRKVPERIAAPCCAQFAVSREAVLKRGREEWVRLREWLVKTEVGSRESGRVLEYTWHLWFGREAEFCPDEAQCLCDVYGVGDCGGEL